jgi:DNA-binding transcriptional regulator YiaG
MTGHRRFSELTAKLPAARKERIATRANELRAEMALAELRQARALSQGELARVLGVKQPAVAKLEKRADM